MTWKVTIHYIIGSPLNTILCDVNNLQNIKTSKDVRVVVDLIEKAFSTDYVALYKGWNRNAWMENLEGS